MGSTKTEIFARLQRDILSIQGFKPVTDTGINKLLGPIKNAFPNASFPRGAIHDFISEIPENATATSGFIAALSASLIDNKGTAIWLGNYGNIFPPALKAFGISPDRIIFIHLKKEKDILWAIEEALKCKGLSAVIAEVQELGFTSSRRLQLAVEESQVTGFIHRRYPVALNTTASVTRWKITSLPAGSPGELPGVGFPRWNVELMRVRNGRPGKWQLEFAAGNFRHLTNSAAITFGQNRKAV